MISLREIIRSVQTRATPCTWGQLQTWLTTELARIKQEGQIMINPPEVILPDGITTTSLVSQSEMTQFVTNTLNVWQAGINGGAGYDIDALLKPAFNNLAWDGTHYWEGTKGDALTVRYLSNYKAILEALVDPDPESSSGASKTSLKWYAKNSSYPSGTLLSGAYLTALSLFARPLPALYGAIKNPLYGLFDNVVVRFIDEAVADDYSNLVTIINNNPGFNIYEEHYFKYAEAAEVARFMRFKPDPKWRAEDKVKMLVSIQENSLSEIGVATNNFEEYPIVELTAPTAWIPAGSTKTYIDIMATWPIHTIE